jgi:hypothetical protein
MTATNSFFKEKTRSLAVLRINSQRYIRSRHLETSATCMMIRGRWYQVCETSSMLHAVNATTADGRPPSQSVGIQHSDRIPSK